MTKRPKRHQLTGAPPLQSVEPAAVPVESPSTAEDDTDADLFADDPLFDELIRDLGEQVCEYCSSPVQWMEPETLMETYPDEVDGFLVEVNVDPDDILLSWMCTECPNFSIVGEHFEHQFLDLEGTFSCSECGATTEPIDPAQGSHLDREGYLRAKREFGAQALLEGWAQRCLSCGHVDYYPA